MKTTDSTELIEIFKGTPWQAEMVKSLLENVEIKSFLKDEIMGTLAPWYASGGGIGPVKVIISKSDYELAKTIVDDYEKNMKSAE